MKIGDKVKIMKTDDNSVGAMKKYLGQEGEITVIDKDSRGRDGCRVKCGDGDDWFWLATSLQLVEDAKTRGFANGDRVRIRCCDVHSSASMASFPGREGVVNCNPCPQGDGHTHVHITVEGKGGGSCYFDATSLEHVEAAKPSFAVGDRVWVKCLDGYSDSSGMPATVGQCGEITGRPISHKDTCWTVKFAHTKHTYYYEETSLEHAVGDAKRSDDVKRAALAAAYGMAPKLTHAATIILASGREVRIPDPDPKVWVPDVSATQHFGLVHEVVVKPDLFTVRATSFMLAHDEARCWASDMARIVNEKDVRSPFETRFSHVTEVRVFNRRLPKIEEYDCAYPALKTLRE